MSASATSMLGTEKKQKIFHEVAHELDLDDLLGDIQPVIAGHNDSENASFDEVKPQANQGLPFQDVAGDHTESTSVSEISTQNLDKHSEISTKTSLKDIIAKQDDHEDIELGDMHAETTPLTNPNRRANSVKPTVEEPKCRCKVSKGRCCLIGAFGILLIGAVLVVSIFTGGDKGSDDEGNPSSDPVTEHGSVLINNLNTTARTGTTLASVVAEVEASTSISTATTTTTSLVEVITYTVSVGMDLEQLPPDTSAETLVKDESFVANVRESLATGLGIKPSEIIISKIELGTRRLQGRQLSNANLKVDFEVVPEEGTAAEVNRKVQQILTPTDLTESNDSSSVSQAQTNFQTLFKDTLVVKEKAAGREVTVGDMKVESKVKLVPATTPKRTTTPSVSSSSVTSASIATTSGQPITFGAVGTTKKMVLSTTTRGLTTTLAPAPVSATTVATPPSPPAPQSGPSPASPASSPEPSPVPTPQPTPPPAPTPVPAPVFSAPAPSPAPPPSPAPLAAPTPAPTTTAISTTTVTTTTTSTTSTTTIPYVRTKAGDAQFLIQATFGPTRSTLSALGGTNYQQWIKDQMTLPAESHRAYYRSRVNPRLAVTKQPTGSPRSRCAKGSRWHSMALTNDDVGKQIKISGNKVLVGGIYRTDIQSSNTAPPTTCTNVEPGWFANKGHQCSTASNIDTRCCYNVYSQTDKYCQQACFDQGFGYDGDDCSTGWAGVDFEGYICAVKEKVSGWVGLSATSDCASLNLRGFKNPAIWVDSSSTGVTDVSTAFQTYKPGIVLLAETVPSCTWGEYVRTDSTTYYRHDSRLELVTNTPDHPAGHTGDTCPTVAKSFLNEKDCKLVSTCIPLHLQNSAFELNVSSLEKFYTIAQKYVYAITGLRSTAVPCGSLSRWEKLDCSTSACTATSGVTVEDAALVAAALTESEGWLRDVDISCSSVPANAVVQVGADFFKNVHLQEHNVYDFTEWVHAHGGGTNAITKWTGLGYAIQFPSGHSMDRWIAGSTQNTLTFIGRKGDMINFQDLPTQLQNQALANAFHSLGGSGYHEVCGSPGESGNDPANGYHAMFYTVHREGEEVIDYRLDSPVTDTLNSWSKRVTTKTWVWTEKALRAQDQLRQRMAWALSQIFVVGTEGFGRDYYSELWVNYYDIFVRNAFGNFRDVLREVTYSPLMGDYLTFKGSMAFDYRGTFPDENYAREIMQLFTIGLWQLNSDGSKQLDANGKMIPTYDNSHVMNFARVFTGFEEQLQRANYESMKATENMIDPMRMLEVKHDMYPKPDLDGNYLGDGYPLCSDLPSGSFLKQGATYEFLGYSYEGSDVLVASASSALYAALCVASGGSCNFVQKLKLGSTLSCFNEECQMETLHVVKVGNGFYEYVPPTCVHLYFFTEGRMVKEAGRRFSFVNRMHCLDPKVIVAGTSCCGGCTNRTFKWMDDRSYTCENGLMPNMFTNKCKFDDGWVGSKFCQLACWQNGVGYPGDDCSVGYFTEKKICSHPAERVSYATAQAKCAAQGLQVCSTDTAAGTCGYEGKQVWTPDSCSIQVAINEDGMVSSEANDDTKQNKFAVKWTNGEFPTTATCPAGCTVANGECVCSINVATQAVFNAVPTKEELEAKLKIGAFAPTDSCTSCSGEVKVYATSGSIDASTVFEYNGRFYKNAESIVHVGSFSFRNPPNFMLANRPSKRAALAEVESLLDHLFNHKNTPLFISYRLIQRFGTSNPTGKYISDVAQAFRTGAYDGVEYSGKYGDLSATVAAILLHPEVRHQQSSDVHGALREPLLKVVHYLRSMEFQNEAHMETLLVDLVKTIGQEPFQSPSVFNFYQTEYQPSSFSSGVVAPEFQIFTAPWAVGLTNGIMSLIDYGVSECDNGFGPRHPSGKSDAAACTHGSYLVAESATVDATLTELDLLLTGGRLTSTDIVKNAYETAGDGDRFKAAQRAIIMTPEFHTLGNPMLTGTRPVQPAVPVTSSGDYKATVLLFLQGGADTFNLIVPQDCSLYDEYKTVRGDIALQSFQLLKVQTTGQSCSKFGIHHKLSFVKQLYDDGKASFVSNIGSLVQPVTKQQFKQGGAQSCVGLFSHSDQQAAAQTLKCQVPGASPRGTGGRIADALREQGVSATSYSIAGTATWSQGFQTDIEIIDANHGAVRLNNHDNLKNVIGNITSREHNNKYCEEYNRLFANAVESTEALGNHLDKVTLQTSFKGAQGPNGDTYLTKQLKQVARLIATRDDRKAERDFFFVTLNGFDLHSDAGEGLEELFKDVDDSLKAFVTEIQAQGVWDNTVIATESDFGRSLQSNGAGTDHAWAGNHMVLGGKVKGGSILNEYPTSLLDGNDQDVGRGRMIPKYPWESMMVPIAEWMGMEDAKKSFVFPNLANFAPSHIIPKANLFNV